MFLERAQVSVVLPLNSYAVNHQLVPNMGALVIWFFIHFFEATTPNLSQETDPLCFHSVPLDLRLMFAQ